MMTDGQPGVGKQAISPKDRASGKQKNVSLGRHEYQCTVCSHPKRQDIEQAFRKLDV